MFQWQKALAALQSIPDARLIRLSIPGGIWVIPGENGESTYDWPSWRSIYEFRQRYHTYELGTIRAMLNRNLIEPASAPDETVTAYKLRSPEPEAEPEAEPESTSA